MTGSLSTASRKCRVPECGVAAEGTCAQGHLPAESCPNYHLVGDAESEYEDELDPGDEELEDEDEDEDEFSTEENASAHADQLALPSGNALDIEGVDEFLRWRPSTFVTIVGEQDSGKTTLICSIYERFLRGPFAGHVFAGSRTLMDLERRSHYSRAVSGGSRPDTPRTSLSEGVRFFHLALARSDALNVRDDLMLSDRAGETYRQVRNNPGLVRELVEVQKADVVVLLLDGERVSSPAERTGAMLSVRQTLRAFIDGGAIDTSSNVQIVTTKIDLFAGLPEGGASEQRLREFQTLLNADFASKVGQLSFYDVAARDPQMRFPPAWQVDVVLRSWLNRPVAKGVRSARPQIPLVTEFDRLLHRTPMGVVR